MKHLSLAGSVAVAVATTLLMVGLLAAPMALAGTVATAVHASTLLVGIASLLLAPDPTGHLRTARRWFAAALATSGAGMIVAVFLADSSGHVPVPSVSDAVSLLWVPLAVTGFWKIPRNLGRDGSRRLLADAALSVSALLFAGWLLVIEPVGTEPGSWWASTLVQSAYPLGDAFVAALVLALLPTVAPELRGFFNAVGFGMVLLAVGDTGATLRVVQQSNNAFGWADIPLQAGMALLVLSPLLPAPRWRSSFLESNLSQLAVVVAGGVGLWQVIGLGDALEADDSVLGALMLAAGICRQLLHTHELTKLAAAHQRAAEHEPLTGLASRHAFFQVADAELLVRAPDQVAVVLLDIDGLDEINERSGPTAGDSVLCQVASLVAGASGPHLVSRVGSDEFAVLLLDGAPCEAQQLSERLSGWHPLTVGDTTLDVGCCAGWATAQPGDRPRDVLGRAALALRAAKHSPARVLPWTPQLTDSAQRRHLVVAGLASAVRRNELSLVFQPVRCLADGSLAAVEALVRWEHPELGSIPPCDFIPLAEDSGHILEIGSWVLREAIAQLARWDDAGAGVPRLFVNLSAKQLDPSLSPLVLNLLQHAEIRPSRLVLEVTESALPDLAGSIPLAELRAAGVQVALDDFGSGYTSLAQLVRLPADILKLDRDLVLNLSQPGGYAVLQSAVHLARSLGLRTVVEGIETEEQLQTVQSCGAEMGQGYFFARPVPAEDLLVPERSR